MEYKKDLWVFFLAGVVFVVCYFAALALGVRAGLPVLKNAEVWLKDTYTVKDAINALPTGRQRVLVFGGSNVLFGFSGGLIEARAPVRFINYGSHAGLPINYQVDKIMQVAKEGDTIFFSPVFASYFAPEPYRDYWYIQNMLTWDRDYRKFLTAKEELRAYLYNDPLRIFQNLAKILVRTLTTRGKQNVAVKEAGDSVDSRDFVDSVDSRDSHPAHHLEPAQAGEIPSNAQKRDLSVLGGKGLKGGMGRAFPFKPPSPLERNAQQGELESSGETPESNPARHCKHCEAIHKTTESTSQADADSMDCHEATASRNDEIQSPHSRHCEEAKRPKQSITKVDSSVQMDCHEATASRNDEIQSPPSRHCEEAKRPRQSTSPNSSQPEDSKIFDEICGLQGKSQGSYLNGNDRRDFAPLPQISLKAESKKPTHLESYCSQPFYGYTPLSLSPHGDFCSQYTPTSLAQDESYFSLDSQVSPFFLSEFKRLLDFAKGRGIRIYLLYPVSMESPLFSLHDQATEQKVRRLEAELARQGIHFANSWQEAHFEKAYFYDTASHLNKYGVVLHSLRFVETLQRLGIPRPPCQTQQPQNLARTAHRH